MDGILYSCMLSQRLIRAGCAYSLSLHVGSSSQLEAMFNLIQEKYLPWAYSVPCNI